MLLGLLALGRVLKALGKRFAEVSAKTISVDVIGMIQLLISWVCSNILGREDSTKR